MSYQFAGQQVAALEAAQLGLRFFPNYADLYYYTGLIQLELKQYALARTALQTAISMPNQSPQYASFAGVRGFRSYYHLGKIAETFINYELALENYLAALRDNLGFSPALESTIQILKPWEDPDYALQCLDNAFDFCTPQSLQMVAEICFRLGTL